MKVEFLGLQEDSNRQNYHNFAIEIIAETDFEQSFFQALFDSTGGKSMYPKGALLCNSGRGCSVMIEAEDFNKDYNEKKLAKEQEERLEKNEQA